MKRRNGWFYHCKHYICIGNRMLYNVLRVINFFVCHAQMQGSPGPFPNHICDEKSFRHLLSAVERLPQLQSLTANYFFCTNFARIVEATPQLRELRLHNCVSQCLSPADCCALKKRLEVHHAKSSPSSSSQPYPNVCSGDTWHSQHNIV